MNGANRLSNVSITNLLSILLWKNLPTGNPKRLTFELKAMPSLCMLLDCQNVG